MSNFSDSAIATLTAMNARPTRRKEALSGERFQPQTWTQAFSASVVSELTRMNPRGYRIPSAQAALARIVAGPPQR